MDSMLHRRINALATGAIVQLLVHELVALEAKLPLTRRALHQQRRGCID